LTTSAPPRPPRPGGPADAGEPDAGVEALIEEARRRARIRRLVLASVAGAVALVGFAVFVGFDWTARSQDSSPEGSARPAATAAATKARIAFYSARTQEGPKGAALYVVDADGGGKRVLTRTAWIDGPEVANGPAWSPDGRRIAFLSVRHHNEDIYVLDLGSGQAHRVTRDPADDREPAWSPDGRKIAFVSERIHGPSGYSSDLYAVNADGSGDRRLTHDVQAAYPAWSPDGRKIAFSYANGTSTYVVNADGSGQRRLGPGALEHSWSPDGHRIAYLDGSSGTFQIYVMNADGTAKHHLARGARPSWSPDGSKIAFIADPAGGRSAPAKLRPEIYVINADGTGLRRLTNNRVWDDGPAWSPDGRMIAFFSLRDGYSEIYVMNPDGSGQRNVSRIHGKRGVGMFDWSPLQRK
jgi:Tol biopolymer transport system component